MTYTRSLICSGILLVGVLCGGCQLPAGHPPETPAELDSHRQSGSQDFTPNTIALHNLRRVLSKDLPADRRIASLCVIERVSAPEVETYPALAQVLSDPKADPALRQQVLALLIRKDYPGLDSHVVSALPHAKDPNLRSAVVDWLLKNPSGELLTDVVKLWAAEGHPLDAEVESRYRRLVERTSGARWDEALLDAINTEDYFARGSAIEVLAARIPPRKLRLRVVDLPPKTPAVRAMKYFAERFPYVPRTGRELLACVVVYGKSRQRLIPASKLAYEWQSQYGYSFNIRDFHLLSRLAGDPLRKPMSRTDLHRRVSGAIAARRARAAQGQGKRTIFRGGRLVSFDAQAESLSMADLWNLVLIDEMLNRSRVRLGLKIVADRDRADRSTRWGGLIWYDQGRAEPKLFPPAVKGGDDQYRPDERMLREAVEAMAFFVGHFSRSGGDESRLDPDPSELTLAKAYNLYGLILARAGDDRLNATYFNPEGTVVDLGEFPIAP